MSYVPPIYTNAGGDIQTGYTPPAYTDVGGELLGLAIFEAFLTLGLSAEFEAEFPPTEVSIIADISIPLNVSVGMVSFSSDQMNIGIPLMVAASFEITGDNGGPIAVSPIYGIMDIRF